VPNQSRDEERFELGGVITGTGMYVPDNIVTNHDLTRIMDTTDEWITTRTGVKERHFADPGVGASDLAVVACRNAMDNAGIGPDEVDALVTATMTPDYMAPGIAGLVQKGVGLGHVAAFDLRQQCSGFIAQPLGMPDKSAWHWCLFGSRQNRNEHYVSRSDSRSPGAGSGGGSSRFHLRTGRGGLWRRFQGHQEPRGRIPRPGH
jgi:hypothetical protein